MRNKITKETRNLVSEKTLTTSKSPWQAQIKLNLGLLEK